MSEQPYPWANAPREFRANAMPAGDLKNGVPGPIVAVREYIKGAGRGGSIRTVKISERLYSRAEAIMLRDGLNAAIRAFELAERLAQAKLPAPRTVILQKESLRLSPASLGIEFPCVLKQPDSAFSLGVVKAMDEADFRTKLEGLFEKSDLVIAQRFMASDFDWRIGILDRKPFFACRYYMARGHWQICNWTSKASQLFGRSDTLRVEDAPPAVVQAALKAANLMGNGFYGVDLKEIDGKVVVIEVNDNPSIDSGVEDIVLKDELYQTVIRSLIARIEDPRKLANGH